MTTHTPGPWEYNDPARFTQGHGKFSETAVYAPGNAFPWRMAEVQCPDHATEVATARLIAAAPELLAMAKLLERSVVYEMKKSERDGDDEGARLKGFTLAEVRAVLAKAEGRTP